MDIVLGNYAQKGILRLSEAELNLYSELLEEADNDIWNWVSGQDATPIKYSALIKKIKHDA